MLRIHRIYYAQNAGNVIEGEAVDSAPNIVAASGDPGQGLPQARRQTDSGGLPILPQVRQRHAVLPGCYVSCMPT